MVTVILKRRSCSLKMCGAAASTMSVLCQQKTGNASIQLTLQRDDGLTLITTMAVNVQDGELTGTSGHDLLDGGESDIAFVIDALDGNDVIDDGYGNDVIHGGDGNDVLTHNWQGNGGDVLYGDNAGNDTLDAGWELIRWWAEAATTCTSKAISVGSVITR